MIVNNHPNDEQSCVLLAEIEGQKITFNLKYKDVTDTIDMINEIFDHKCKVYVSGYNLVSKGTNLTRKQSLERIQINTTSEKEKEKVRALLMVK